MIVLRFKATVSYFLPCLGSLNRERARVSREEGSFAGEKERGGYGWGLEEDSDGQRNFGSVPPYTGGGGTAGRRARKDQEHL